MLDQLEEREEGLKLIRYIYCDISSNCSIIVTWVCYLILENGLLKYSNCLYQILCARQAFSEIVPRQIVCRLIDNNIQCNILLSSTVILCLTIMYELHWIDI